ncbi:MAG: hypothetical protein ACC707_19720 [Thiohalomonadales bacterium]
MKKSPLLLCDEIIGSSPYLLVKIIKNCQLSDALAHNGLVETIKFLDLIALLNQQLTPSIIVDKIWHEFILFTRIYTTMCAERYDRYIHHNPGGSDVLNESNYKATIQYYTAEYGIPDPEFWGRLPDDYDGNCGSCSSETI